MEIKSLQKKINNARSLNIRAVMQETMHEKRLKDELFGIYNKSSISFEKRLMLGQERKLKQ